MPVWNKSWTFYFLTCAFSSQNSHCRIMKSLFTWCCDVCLKNRSRRKKILSTFSRGPDSEMIQSKLRWVWQMFTQSLMFFIAQFVDGTNVYRWENQRKREHRPFCSVTVQNERPFLGVNKGIEEKPYICTLKIYSRCGLPRGTVEHILHNDLHLKNIFARLIPDPDKKKQWVLYSNELLIMFEPCGSKWFCNVMGGKMWLSFHKIWNRQANLVWLGENTKRTANFQIGFLSFLNLFL